MTLPGIEPGRKAISLIWCEKQASNNNNIYKINKERDKEGRDKLANLVEDEPKAPFSMATTPRCREGRYSIPRIAQLFP